MFAAVLFQRRTSELRRKSGGGLTTMFLLIEKEQAAAIRQKLLEAMVSEQDKSVRNLISDAVAELARQYAEESSSLSANLLSEHCHARSSG
jgi:hypothetical protein